MTIYFLIYKKPTFCKQHSIRIIINRKKYAAKEESFLHQGRSSVIKMKRQQRNICSPEAKKNNNFYRIDKRKKIIIFTTHTLQINYL